jgi:hypothetical protein
MACLPGLDVLRSVSQTSSCSLHMSIKIPIGVIASPYKDQTRIRPHTCIRLHRFEPSVFQRRAACANIDQPQRVLLRRAARRKVSAEDI